MPAIQAIIYVIAGVAALVGTGFYGHVHSPRWTVKTLGDSFVVSERATPTTIQEQQALRAPKTDAGLSAVDESVTRLGGERTLYSLSGLLVHAQEMEDGDYHLVLEDPKTGLRIVAEIPDGTAPMQTRYRNYCLRARHTIDSLIGKLGPVAISPPVPPLIEVIGIGFFDEPHLITPAGMAPNFREIHPVLWVNPK